MLTQLNLLLPSLTWKPSSVECLIRNIGLLLAEKMHMNISIWSLKDHIKHCKIVIDIFKWEKLYLSATKLYFLAKVMKIIGHVIDEDGICMDPNKVDFVLHWKTPTLKDLLWGFLRSVGYLVDKIANIQILMGILFSMIGFLFRWEPTHQQAGLVPRR